MKFLQELNAMKRVDTSVYVDEVNGVFMIIGNYTGKKYGEFNDEKSAETEADIIQRRLNKAAPAVNRRELEDVRESAEYNSSSDFTEDFTEFGESLHKLKMMIGSPMWRSWMKTTDKNYNTKCEVVTAKMATELDKVQALYGDLSHEIMKADEG